MKTTTRMQQTSQRKLNLHKETLRQLGGRELGRAVAGAAGVATGPCTGGCDSLTCLTPLCQR